MSRKPSAPRASLCSLLCLLCVTARAQQPPIPGSPGAGLGQVHFENSCSVSAQGPFEHAMALLHSFEFGPAMAGFRAALAADPGCAIADWGIALSSWGNPFAPGLKARADLERGRDAGLWEESIHSNTASVAASRREGNVTEELHASDYLLYAYLQSGRDAAAKQVLGRLPEVESRLRPDAVPIGAAPLSAAYFAMAAMPARYALERGDWAAATQLKVRPTSYPYTDAITWFALGMGAARLGEAGPARDAARQLAAIHQRLIDASEDYWARQVEIQQADVLAWAALGCLGNAATETD